MFYPPKGLCETGVQYQGATGYNSPGPEKMTGSHGALKCAVGPSRGPNLRRRRLTEPKIMGATAKNSRDSCGRQGRDNKLAERIFWTYHETVGQRLS